MEHYCNSKYSAYAENSETLDIEQLVWIAGIGNLIGAGRGHLPADFLKKVVFMDLVKIHNSADSGSNIRRMAREEILNRDGPFSTWYGLYVLHAKRKTLLHKMSAIKILEKATCNCENYSAYEVIHQAMPELRVSAAETVLSRVSDPETLRNIIGLEKKFPILGHMARMKLYKMFTL